MKSYAFSILFILLLLTSCHKEEIPESASGISLFSKSGTEEIYGSTNLDDGGMVLVGMVDFNFFAMAVDPEGREKWYSKFGGIGKDRLNDATQTKDGNIVAVGNTTSREKGSTNSEPVGYIVKLSQSGSVLWEKHYGFETYHTFLGVEEQNDGSLILTGMSSFGSANTWIMKLSADGDSIWESIYDLGPQTPWHDFATASYTTKDGGVIVAGYCSPSAFVIEVNKYIPYAFRVNGSDGKGEWVSFFSSYQRGLNVNGVDLKSFIYPNNTGYTFINSMLDLDTLAYAQLITLSADGYEVKHSNHYGEGEFIIMGSTLDEDGSISMTGSTREKRNTHYAKCGVIYVNPSGEETWSNFLGSDERYQVSAALSKNATGWSVLGASFDVYSGNTKFIHYMLNSKGEVINE
jgi:hypothetical protein